MGRAGSGPEFHVTSGSGRVGHFTCESGWVGLGWVKKIGPTSNSEPTVQVVYFS